MENVTCIFSQACFDVNKKVLDGFNALNDDDFRIKTHLFNGRFENLYLEQEKIPGLEVIVDTAMQQAAKLLNVDVDKLVSGFWLNAMRPGDITTAHTHDDDDELLSCVYYISVPEQAEKSGQLIITLNNERTVITPKEGMFVFFSPSTLHEVSQNETDEARLSIAFNFGKNA